ncbi:MAG: S46 family peptidase [Bacteroidetes bacterium]|uniref:Dipeptidyl-peptidase n=1 Tax=Candidatus Cryptobacteroides merdavium TaxID=2840769 RepID=A0A9D9EBP9_9BACT|nr:S46 family peptidase [Candidatus Cryptobacteroides merdavium]
MLSAAFFDAHADEGMWLPSLISQRIEDMQAKGFRLTAEDIYSINSASLKDAVVLFGRGCTGELISDEGLLLTNHHCGYSQIQKHSSVEHDYLRDGFWAMNRDEELPNEGLTVSFLERMEDVTDAVLQGYSPEMTETQRDSVVKANSGKLVEKATAEGNGLRATVEALYYGNQYFLFLYREYSDVRLVGAPPSSVGKFGGDTDNWMWPRHTGDFSIFRIYADKDNNPAPYSEDNVPYRPKRHFRISLGGVEEGDFTFVYGFPGRTQEYLMSEGVRYISEVSDPHRIALRTMRLDIQKKYMDAGQAVRIQYSSKNAGVANSWKKWQGEMKGIRKMGTVGKKQEYEKAFMEWARGTEYEGVVERLDSLYGLLEPYSYATDYYGETAYSIELVRFALGYNKKLTESMLSSSTDRIAELRKEMKKMAADFYKDYFIPIDRESFVAVMEAFDRNVTDDFKPEYFKESLTRYGTMEAWADSLWNGSVFADSLKLKKATDSLRLLSEDPAVKFGDAFDDWYKKEIRPVTKRLNSEITLLNRDYMRGQMEFSPDRVFYPDANLTLRVAYGSVQGYSPADGIYYKPVSTLEGIMEKDNPEIFDYNIPQRLREIHAAKDYGPYTVTDSKGNITVPVCFIATNHTSGGNSGSPVINADGDLIGINFDRVWEGTMSDIVFDPDLCRNISLDIRYVLFIIDKVAGAGHLLEEMDFVSDR